MKPSVDEPEVLIQFNFNFDYYAGTGQAPGGTIDLETIALHEVTHGLGFLGLVDENGDSRLEDCEAGTSGFAVFDTFAVRGSTGQSLFGGTPPAFLGTVADITTRDVLFEGPQALDGYNFLNEYPGIYAPFTFREGSSMAHLDTGRIAFGPVVMEHAIPSATEIREYAGAEIGVLRDLGYTAAADPFNPGCNGMGGVADDCGECNGENTICLGCDGVPNSGLIADQCGVCDGDGLSCFGIIGRNGFYEVGDALELEAVGPEGDYQWLLDWQVLPGATGQMYAVSELSLSDSGAYAVRVTNAEKAVFVSEPLSITVVPVGALPFAGRWTLALLVLVLLALGAASTRAKGRSW